MKKYIIPMLAMLLLCAPAYAYTIDGDLSDWGLNLSQDWSQESTWLPNSGVQFQVEDNQDPSQTGGSYTGVHIQGVGSSYSSFVEPKIQLQSGHWVLPPFGSPKELFDLEAIYFDQDSTHIYIAVVTSEPQDSPGEDDDPGDLAINADHNSGTGVYGYEYGVKIGTGTGLNQWDLCYLPDWEEGKYAKIKPTIFKTANSCLSGVVQGSYVDLGVTDHGKTNYIIEMAIPKSDIGGPTYVSFYDIFLSELCGNDGIPVPEFAILTGIAILLTSPAFAYLLVKRRKN